MLSTKAKAAIGIIAVAFIFLIGVFAVRNSNQSHTPEIASSTQGASGPQAPAPDSDEGTLINLRFRETGTRQGVSITPLRLVSDNRCALDVDCVWAGTIEVEAAIETNMGESRNTYEIGTSITTEAQVVTLVAVTPHPVSSDPIEEEEYRFTFEVKQRQPIF